MLEVDHLSFSYGNHSVLEDLSFRVSPGEYLAVMGESGCGKSTLLKLLYGALPFEGGRIRWKQHPIKGPEYQLVPGGEFIKYLAQDFDLMPYATVAENLQKFLSAAEPEETNARIAELLNTMDLEPYRDVKVNLLSGGEQQRVALARVLARRPEVLLLDEPFSHIDHFRRNKLRRNLFGFLKSEKISCICASHDYHDVLPFADRIMVLRDRDILDLRPTAELFEKPRKLYTAELLGEANLVPIEVLKSYASTTRNIIVYSHEFRMSRKSGMPVTVKHTYYFGSHYRIYGIMESGKGVYFDTESPIEKGKKIYLNVSLETINKRMPI
ncbi:ABC transporter ATP-binding protein [Robiginitalea sp.]|uniref:ABC transporter ATP-binding protein n=1 Tax=Robiginitalea sp. TaxID=1902411 RepID=UPI003C4D52FA